MDALNVMQAMQNPTGVTSARELFQNGALGMGAGGGDGFAAIFMQLMNGGLMGDGSGTNSFGKNPLGANILGMLGQNSNEEELPLDALLMGNQNGIMDVLSAFGEDEDSDDTTDQNAILNAMQVLSGNMLPMQQNIADMVSSENAALISGETARQMLSSGVDVSVVAQYLKASQKQVAAEPEQLSTTGGETTSATAEETKAKAFSEALGIISAGYGSEKAVENPYTGNALSLEHQFKSSVLEAQRLIDEKNGKDDKNEVLPIDVEELQAAVDTGRFGAERLEKTPEKGQLPTAKELLSQAEKGIRDGIAAGNKEFIVKLKPEGLGEITVKLSEGGNKISLSIVTASSETAKLISGEVEALKLSLRPLNAEVREIVVMNSEQKDSAAHGQNAFSQSSQQERQPHQQSETPQYYYTADNEPDDAAQSAMSYNTELNTYI